MSILVRQTASVWSPAYNDNYGVIISTDKTNNTNFQYEYRIYVDSELKHTARSWPEPVYSTGVYSANRIFENYITYDLQPTITAVATRPNSIISGSIKAYETWTSASVTVSGSEKDLGSFYLINAALDYETMLDNNIENDYIPVSGSVKKFLTDHYTSSIKLTDYATLSWLNGSVSQYEITTYDASGNYLAGYYYPAPANPTTNASRSLEGPAGPMNLNAGSKFKWNGSSWDNYTGSIVDSSVAYYDIKGSWFGDHTITQTRRYNVNTECSRYEDIQLMWQNKWGGWEYFTFDKVSRNTTSKETVTYRKRYYQHNASNRYDYDKGDRASTVLSNNIQDSLIVTSNWVTDNESAMIKELFTSPEVYYIKDGETLPMIVADSSWETKKTINDKLINYTVSLNYAYTGNVQRG